MNIGDNIKTLRLLIGMLHEQLAEKVGETRIHDVYIAKNLKFDTLYKLTRSFLTELIN
jgi:hypothetical protein